jgi:hypothetical protein
MRLFDRVMQLNKILCTSEVYIVGRSVCGTRRGGGGCWSGGGGRGSLRRRVRARRDKGQSCGGVLLGVSAELVLEELGCSVERALDVRKRAAT